MYQNCVDRESELLDNGLDGIKCVGNSCKDKFLQNVSDADHKIEKCAVEGVNELKNANSMYGNVYRRK